MASPHGMIRILTIRLSLHQGEAKIEVPNIDRLGSGVPFLYKRIILVDNAVDVVGSCELPPLGPSSSIRCIAGNSYLPLTTVKDAEYGLNTTYNTFSPPDTSNATTFDYDVASVLQATLSPSSDPNWTYPVSTYQYNAHLPW